MPQQNNNNSYRLGADYNISSKNTIGFVVSGYFNGEDDNNSNITNIGKNFNVADSSLRTISAFHQTYNNFAVNLNDTYKLDTAGQEISVDLDYSKFKNSNISAYMTDFYLPGGGVQKPSAFLGNHTPSIIDIHTGKVDYTKHITKAVKMETALNTAM